MDLMVDLGMAILESSTWVHNSGLALASGASGTLIEDDSYRRLVLLGREYESVSYPSLINPS